jgi:hypothetical protein
MSGIQVINPLVQLHEVQGVAFLVLRFQRETPTAGDLQREGAYVHLTMTGPAISSFFAAAMEAKDLMENPPKPPGNLN